MARQALATWKAEIVLREEGRVKNAYLRRLGRSALGLAAPSLAGAAAARILPHFVPLTDAQPLGRLSVYGNFALLLVGCAAGVWLSFGARRTRWQFEDLAVPESDRVEPGVRVALAAAATATVGLLLVTGVVDVTLGGVSAAAFVGRGDLALVIGVLCGFSERSLSGALGEQAAKLILTRG